MVPDPRNDDEAPPEPRADVRTIRWQPDAGRGDESVGLEHLRLRPGAADGLVLACDEEQGPFRLQYDLTWDAAWQLREAVLTVAGHAGNRALALQVDAQGTWHRGDGTRIAALEGCLDIDIWPTPFTNTFPIRRARIAVGQRREFRVAWVCAPQLTVTALRQAYTRLSSHRYRLDSLDGSGFRAELDVDDDGIVIDYPGLFRRIACPSASDPG